MTPSRPNWFSWFLSRPSHSAPSSRFAGEQYIKGLPLRATGDIGFLYEQSPENVERLCAALIDSPRKKKSPRR